MVLPSEQVPAVSLQCVSCSQAFPEGALFCPGCGTARSAGGPDPMQGMLIGDRYLILDKLGQGGSGTIYRAEHVTLRRKVALKLIHQALASDDLSIERFRREATTVGEIDNDHIVEVHDFGRAPDGRLFLVMELLDGETLADLLARTGAQPIGTIVDVLAQLGEALMEAHAMGYVHRDLRPRNVFLTTRRGRPRFVKLLDFGLAKLVEAEGDTSTTSLGMTFGDARYMSPEQAAGGTVDRRTDIYALGVMAYEMLTGAVPFDGAGTAEILTHHLQSMPQPPRERRPDTPGYLESAVLSALAKAPAERFPTVYRLVEALREGERSAPRRSGSLPVATGASLGEGGAGDGAPFTSPGMVALPAGAPGAGSSEAVPVPVKKSHTAIIKLPPEGAMTGAWFAEGENLAAAADDSAALPAQGKSRRKGEPPRGKRKRARTALVPPLAWNGRASETGGSSASVPAVRDGGRGHDNDDRDDDDLDDSMLMPRRRRTLLWVGIGIAAAAAAVLIWVLVGSRNSGKKATVTASVTDSPNPSTSPSPSTSTSTSTSPSTSPSTSTSTGPGTSPGPRTSPGTSGPRPSARPSAGEAAAIAALSAARRDRDLRDGIIPTLAPTASPSASPSTPDTTSPAAAAIKRGEDALAANRASDAEAAFNEARALDPGGPTATAAIIGLGEVALLQGKPAEAAVHFGEAARRRPRSARVQRLLARALEGAGDPSGAEAARERALALDRVPETP